MAGKVPSKERLAQAIKVYEEKHPGTLSVYDAEKDAYYLKDANGLEAGLGPWPKCSSQSFFEELSLIIADLNEEVTTAPQRQDHPARQANTPAPRRSSISGQMVGITPQDIINYINPKATEAEAYLFAEFCKRKGADPMTKQVYLVIYEGQNGRQANFIAGKEYFTEKAEAHPQFDGFEAGIIVVPVEGGALEYREGTFWMPKTEILVGGWATVHRKDRKIASKSMIPLSDYDTKKNLWAKMPATMIRKVALVQALREAFPANFGGMYDRAEMDQAYEGGAA